jgi:hypothetical protein
MSEFGTSVVVVERNEKGMVMATAKHEIVQGQERIDCDLLCTILDTDDCEPCDWQMSNHERGCIWMDTVGKIKCFPPTLVIMDPLTRKVQDYMCGTLVFTGGLDTELYDHGMSRTTANLLAASINQGYPIRVMGCYMALLEGIRI